MSDLRSGDVVTVDFPGVTGVKRRPAVVVSSETYHAERPDVILGVVTTNLAAAMSSLDYVLRDWQSAGLRSPSAFRACFGMALPSDTHRIGKLSEHDWQATRQRVKRALA